jgi:hypothetical protein
LGNINITRMLLGGLLAGLVIGVGEYILSELVLEGQLVEVFADASIGELAGGQFVALAIVALLYGITAVVAGLTMWVVAWLLVSAYLVVVGGYPAGLMIAATIWGLFELPVAAIAGAWFYQEIEAG